MSADIKVMFISGVYFAILAIILKILRYRLPKVITVAQYRLCNELQWDAQKYLFEAFRRVKIILCMQQVKCSQLNMQQVKYAAS